MPESRELLPLPVAKTSEGKERRVGVELEMSGLGYKELVDRVQDVLKGKRGREDYYETIVETELGDFLVELDSAPVKALKDERTRDLPEPLAQLRNGAMDLMEAVAEQLVPLEVVTPPLPVSELPLVETLCDYLRGVGALGSRHSLYFAFGCQLNPELPDLEPETILRYLRAFAGLYAWLRQRQQLDISRKFTTYINPWPRQYVDMITARGYHPSLEELLIDYVEYNPTRNRALDLMPLWAHLRPDLLWQMVDDKRIKARPTLHYRLPDCDIDNRDWHFSHVWNDWIAVEAMACNEPLLDEFLAAFRQKQKWNLENLGRDWAKECNQWVQRALAPISG